MTVSPILSLYWPVQLCASLESKHSPFLSCGVLNRISFRQQGCVHASVVPGTTSPPPKVSMLCQVALLTAKAALHYKRMFWTWHIKKVMYYCCTFQKVRLHNVIIRLMAVLQSHKNKTKFCVGAHFVVTIAARNVVICVQMWSAVCVHTKAFQLIGLNCRQ